MKIETALAFRYFVSRRNHPFINVIKGISVLGVALGVAALVVVLGVMNGFEKDLKEKIVGIYAHAVIESDTAFPFTDELRARIGAGSDAVVGVAPYVQGQALLEHSKSIEGILLRASRGDQEKEVSRLPGLITEGAYPAEGSRQILLGDVLGDLFRVKVGDELRLFTSDKRDPVPVTVTGIFHTGMYEYDAHLAYVPLGLGQEMFRMGQNVSGVAVRYRDPEDALRHKRTLQENLGYPFYVRTWNDMNRSLFGALKLEKTVMFIILTLITLVACFNIAGTLTLLVIDRTKDIGVLRSLGATSGQILRIFTMNGLLIGFSGTAAGLLAGLGACFVLKRYPFIEIPSDIYYFGRLPVEINPADAGLIAASALVLAFLSTLYPAVSAASMKPVTALRYE